MKYFLLIEEFNSAGEEAFNCYVYYASTEIAIREHWSAERDLDEDGNHTTSSGNMISIQTIYEISNNEAQTLLHHVASPIHLD